MGHTTCLTNICVLEQSGTKVLEEIGKKSHVIDKKVMIKPHQIQINYDILASLPDLQVCI